MKPPSPHRPQKDLRIGHYVVDRRACLIRGNGRSQSVSPKAIQVLDRLAEAAPETVSRTTFIDRVWDDNYVVGEHGLRDAIWELRKALDDSPRSPRFIQTIPRKGYRLLVQPKRQSLRLGAIAAAATLACCGILALTLGRTEPPPAAAPSSWQGAAPVLSGDARYAAFAKVVNGQSDLFIAAGELARFGSEFMDQPPSPEHLLQVTHSSARKISPVWAPNHRDLAFIEHEPHAGSCRVKVFLRDGEALKTLAEDCYVVTSPMGQVPAQLDWLGDTVAYQARVGEQAAAISLASVSRGQSTRLTHNSQHVDAFPRFSSDGRLAFVRLKDPMVASGELQVVDPQGRPLLECAELPVWGLAWTDNRHLAVTAAVNNPFRLWLYDTETGASRSLKQPARYLQPTVVRNALLVDVFHHDGVLRQIQPARQGPPRTIDTVGRAMAVDYSASTGSLAVTMALAGRQRLEWSDSSGQRRHLHTAMEIYRPRFSPDGQQLAFTARDSVRENVVAWVLSKEDPVPRRLSSRESATFFAEWDTDGGYYLLRGIPNPLGRGARLMKVGADGAVEEAIARGASLQVIRDNQGGLWWSDDSGLIQRRHKGAVKPVLGLGSVYESWTVNRATGDLYFSRTRSHGTEIRALSPDGRHSLVETMAHHLDPIVGLNTGPFGSLMLLRSTTAWQHRHTIAVPELLDAANHGPWDRQSCRRLEESSYALSR